MLLEHVCIPRLLKPTEVVPLFWGQALAEAGEAVQDFLAVLLRYVQAALQLSALAQVFE